MGLRETLTPSVVIKRYLEIREMKAAREAEHKKALAEADALLTVLENWLMNVMNERGEPQIKTDFGTAFKSPQLRVSMEDREKLKSFVLDELEKGNEHAFDVFTNHVDKAFVKAFMDEHQDAAPPGIYVTRYVNCNVRKA